MPEGTYAMESKLTYLFAGYSAIWIVFLFAALLPRVGETAAQDRAGR